MRASAWLMLVCLISVQVDGCGFVGGGRSRGQRAVKCVGQIDVATGSVPVEQDVYVCEDVQVFWNKLQGVNSFTVHFPNDCPFKSCADINDSTPQTVEAQDPNHLKVYKYEITVNKVPFPDPHVVGGGGH